MTERPSGYSMLGYGHMVTSEPRMSAYTEALRRAVTPGCTVIDLGAGPGVFSVLACKFGAGSVIAIDPDDSLELVPEIAQANGCADKITVFKGRSSDYSGPKADVIISDIRGVLPLFEGHVAAITDARERLLAPGGSLIPARDSLYVAVVRTAEHYRPYEEPWLRNNYEIDLSAAHRFVVNAVGKMNLSPQDLLSRPEQLAVLDYYTISEPNFSRPFSLTVDQAGTAHGLLVWFDAELGPGVGFSNAPGEPKLIYGQTFFPFERAVDVEPGDEVTGELGARLVEGDYVWSWTSAFSRAGASRGIAYRQSNFLATLYSPESLRRRDSRYAPPERAIHAVDAYCLSLFDGRRSLEEIAAAARERFPNEFGDSSAALNHVIRLDGRYQDPGSQ